jgi:hypothetical protein
MNKRDPIKVLKRAEAIRNCRCRHRSGTLGDYIDTNVLGDDGAAEIGEFVGHGSWLSKAIGSVTGILGGGQSAPAPAPTIINTPASAPAPAPSVNGFNFGDALGGVADIIRAVRGQPQTNTVLSSPGGSIIRIPTVPPIIEQPVRRSVVSAEPSYATTVSEKTQWVSGVDNSVLIIGGLGVLAVFALRQ